MSCHIEYLIAIIIAEIMTDKPPAYENQFPAGYGMQSEQPGGWTAAAPPPRQQQGNFPPQYQQQQQQQQQQQPTVTQYVCKYDINS